MEEKKKRVKDRIVSAAWELFYEKGYDATTVDDIIRLSDTSKGSFYYYFDGKDALLNTLSTVLDDLYLSLKEEMDPYMDSFEKLMFLNYRSHLFMERSIRLICWRPCILPSSSRKEREVFWIRIGSTIS